MVTYLNDTQIEGLLNDYELEDILEMADLSKKEVLQALLEAGLLSDLPDEVVPL